MDVVRHVHSCQAIRADGSRMTLSQRSSTVFLHCSLSDSISTEVGEMVASDRVTYRLFDYAEVWEPVYTERESELCVECKKRPRCRCEWDDTKKGGRGRMAEAKALRKDRQCGRCVQVQ